MTTAAKRVSAINVSCPWRGVLPQPDGTVGAGDRQTVALMYDNSVATASQAYVIGGGVGGALIGA